MKIRHTLPLIAATTLLTLLPASADDKRSGPKPSEAEMMEEMMKLGQPGEQHKLLDSLAGTWRYQMKYAGSPGGPLVDAGSGTAVRKTVMAGRYSTMEVSGKMAMPGADGKMQEMDFQGMSTDAYDNVKKKFVSTWIDSMGTSITMSEGTYDAAAKAFTYEMEMEMMPGVKTQACQVITLVDADHERMDWYETHGGKQVKTMEITYTRQK